MVKENAINISEELTCEATEWFLKLKEDDFSVELSDEWQEWLNVSELHEVAFRRVEKMWSRLDHVSDLPWPNENEIALDFIDEIDNRQKGYRLVMPYVAAIAATVMIYFSVTLYMQTGNDDTFQTASTHQTDIAQNKDAVLGDGSELIIGAKSLINVDYSNEKRKLTLVRGEAVFKVVKDKKRPFVVQIGNGTVTAIGTIFNIHHSTQSVTVTVLEGIVEVDPLYNANLKQVTRVSAGNSVTYFRDGSMTEMTKANLDAVTSWGKGVLVKVNEPLDQVIEDVNRYSSKEIIIGDNNIKNLRFTGTIFNGEVGNWLKGLELGYPIKVMDTGQNTYLLLAKSNK